MKLYRSVRDKKLSGLCGGLAESFNIDVTVLRLVVLIAVFFSGGTVLLIYILASLVVPKETDVFNDYSYQQGPHFREKETHNKSYYEPKADPSELDAMMKDIEKKAMEKELEELRAKVAQYEKGDK